MTITLRVQEAYRQGSPRQLSYLNCMELLDDIKRERLHAYRAGASAAREADCLAVCSRCRDGQELIDGKWHRQGTEMLISCGAIDIRSAPLPEMPE